MKKNCYATLITDIKYLPCVIRCKQTMEHFNTAYPYLALIPEGDQHLKAELEKNNILCREIQIKRFFTNNKYQMWFYEDTINKFQLFNLIEYEKICFLDADVVLAGNIDDEFDKFTGEEEVFLYSPPDPHHIGISGTMFIIRPDVNYFDTKILPLIATYENDEQILEHYYPYQIGLRQLTHKIIHFSGFLKPWQKGDPYLATIKHLFLHSTKEEFVAWVENIKEVQSLRKAWEAYVNLLKPYLYVAIVKNENELDSIQELRLNMQNMGFIYPLMVCLPDRDELIKKFFSSNIDVLYHIVPDKAYETNVAQLKCVFDACWSDYSKVCFISDVNMRFQESIDYIFSKTLHNDKREQFKSLYGESLLVWDL